MRTANVTTPNSRLSTTTRSGNGSSSRGSQDATLQLSAIVAGSESRDDLYKSLLDWLAMRPRCAGAGFFIDEDGELAAGPIQFDNPALASETFQTAVRTSAELACRSGNMHSAPVEKIRNLAVVSVPIVLGARKLDALSGAIVAEPDEPPDDTSLLTAAAYATLWHAGKDHQRTHESLLTTAATLDLLSTLSATENFRAATITLVNSLRDHLECRGVVLGLTKGSGGRCRVAAMSGMADFDNNATITRKMEDVLDECIARKRLSVFPAIDSSNRDALLAHKTLHHDLQTTRLVSHPLTTSSGEVIGAWLVVDDAPDSANDVALVLRAAASRVADALSTARRADSSLFGNRSRTKSRLRWIVRGILAAAAITAIMMIPVSYRIYSDCSAEPEVRRFIVAPHEGLLEKTFVEPGDVVTAGQMLARMDGRDVRWELAGLAAEKRKAGKDRDSGLVKGDAAASQRANLELKRVQAREQVLLSRKDQLDVTSPISGIVLDGHLDRVENAPVTIGQALYEVAPLSPVTVEVAIADDEYTNVKIGFEATVSFDGIDESFDGTITRIRPRSEIRDRKNVFIAEVVLDNEGSQLRPGMSGYARIKGRTQTLGWTLFHKPWEHLRKSLPF